MSRRIPPEKIWQIRDLYIAGFTHYEIMRVVGVCYSSVYLYCIRNRESLAMERENLEPDEIWTKEQKQDLTHWFYFIDDDGWEQLPEFTTLCQKLKKEPQSVIMMARGLQLGVVKPAPKPRPKMPEINDIVQKKFIRPKPVYTNIPTPYGIASQLHSGNRILRTA